MELRAGVLHGVRLRERKSEDFPDSPRHPMIVRIMRHIQSGKEDFGDLKLDESDLSDLEKLVVRELRKIPAGSTATYTEIAERIGKPRSARAVANAVGRNPFYIVVPCHRVVGKEGDLGGYSGFGGVETKKKLLQAEGAIEKPVFLEP